MSDQINELSDREIEILRLVATGAPNKEIAQKLVISPNTVKVHLRNIFVKIGVSSRTEATLYAIQAGLINPSARQEMGGVEDAPEEVKAQLQTEEPPDPTPVLPVQEGPLVLSPAEKNLPLPQHLSLLFARYRAQVILLILIVIILSGSALLWITQVMNKIPATSTAPSTLATMKSVPARWSMKSSLPSPRKGMAVAVYEDKLFMMGGETAQGITSSAFYYSQKSNTWKPITDKPTSVTDIQAAVMGEKIYVPGGRMADGKTTDVLEVYNPILDIWETKAPLPHPVSGYALIPFEGNLYLFGGKNGEQYFADAFTYNPQNNVWETIPAMSTARAFLGAAVSGDKIFVMGGFDGKKALTLNETFRPARLSGGGQVWETATPMPEGRYAMGITSLASFIYVIGGMRDSAQSGSLANMQYLDQQDQWNMIDAAPQSPGAFLAVVPSGSYLHLLGGQTQEGLSSLHQMYQAIYTLNVPNVSNEQP